MGTSYTKESYLELKAKGWSFARHVEAGIKGIKASQDINAGHDWSDQFQNSMSKQHKSQSSFGGDPAHGCGHDSEAPMMLDLRPISALLNPVNFPDPIIYHSLRFQLDVALLQYATRSRAQLASGTAWEPYLFEVVVDEIRMDEVDGNLGDIELFGRVLNNGYSDTPDVDTLVTRYGSNGVAFRRTWREGRANPIDEGESYKVPPLDGKVVYAVLHSQICNGYARILGKLSDEQKGFAVGVRYGQQFLDIPWNEMNQNQKEFKIEFTDIDDESSDDLITVRGTYKRLPNLDGFFKNLPACR